MCFCGFHNESFCCALLGSPATEGATKSGGFPDNVAALVQALREAGCNKEFAIEITGELDEETLLRFFTATISFSWLAGVRWLCDERPETAAASGPKGVSGIGLNSINAMAGDAAECVRLLLERGFADDDAESGSPSRSRKPRGRPRPHQEGKGLGPIDREFQIKPERPSQAI